jgi:hypothetical protein
MEMERRLARSEYTGFNTEIRGSKEVIAVVQSQEIEKGFRSTEIDEFALDGKKEAPMVKHLLTSTDKVFINGKE